MLLGIDKVLASYEDEILFLHRVLRRHGIDVELEFLLEKSRRHEEIPPRVEFYALVEFIEYYPDGLKTLDPEDWR